MEYLEINDSNKKTVLELFNKSIDSEGYIIEKKTKKQLICPYTQDKINASNFSILPDGTATFVNNKYFSFAEHLAAHR
ncbi:hypothetical protein BMS3Bbin16_00506 [archaeon BMS3Bbin16]|nr:hypothetical protein BMS3Bbin16_00506 [archaeon BMS3Bbin16]